MRPLQGFALLFSVLLHLIVTLVVLPTPSHPGVGTGPDNSPKSVQVKTISEADFQKQLKNALDEKSRQIVQTDERLKSDLAPSENRKYYLSKHNSVVDQDTRAARFGKFKNVLSEGVEAPSPAEKLFNLARSEKDLEQSQSLISKTGLLRAPASLPSTEKKAAGEGFSASEEYLPDLAIGANTLLNAKEFVFYGFYERIREKLSYEWRMRLDSELYTIESQGETLGRDRTTKLEVVLDKNGVLKKVRIIGTSGMKELDRAATQAFVGAAPFPNPPAGMLEREQEVSIRWDFVVVAESTGGVRFDVRRLPTGSF